MAAPQKKVQKITTPPVNMLFRFFQTKVRIEVWLVENTDLRIEGKIIGFDEFMNLTLDDAAENHVKTKRRRDIGRILLKGENITLIRSLEEMSL